jgi:hypothetical protein
MEIPDNSSLFSTDQIYTDDGKLFKHPLIEVYWIVPGSSKWKSQLQDIRRPTMPTQGITQA